jgi:hypothetical protein
MDGVSLSEDNERQLHEVMTDLGLTRDEAMIVIGLAPGHHVSDDVVSLYPLSEAERKRLGLGRDLAEVMAEQRARQARETSQSFTPPNGRDSTGAADDGVAKPSGDTRPRRAANRPRE